MVGAPYLTLAISFTSDTGPDLLIRHASSRYDPDREYLIRYW